jgi:hypothetical protein
MAMPDGIAAVDAGPVGFSLGGIKYIHIRMRINYL